MAANTEPSMTQEKDAKGGLWVGCERFTERFCQPETLFCCIGFQVANGVCLAHAILVDRVPAEWWLANAFAVVVGRDAILLNSSVVGRCTTAAGWSGCWQGCNYAG